MSEMETSVLIANLRAEAEGEAGEWADISSRVTCPIWGGRFKAIEASDDDRRMVYSFRAGGAFYRPKGVKALDCEPQQKAAISAEIYRLNLRGEMPNLCDIMGSAALPGYEDRIGRLLIAISSREEREGHGCELGERNYAADEPGETPIIFRSELLAATGSETHWELQQITDDAKDRKLLKVSADPHSDSLYGRIIERGFELVRSVKARMNLMPRLPAVPLEERTAVPIAADTNFFMEFGAVKGLPWHELFPKAREIRLIVLPKVGDEIDAFKRGIGRLRRRAMEMGAFAREMESAPGERITLVEGSLSLTMEFAPIFRRDELDQNLFDLEDSDGKIVAEAYRMASSIPDLVFMSDDSKPLRLARKAGLQVVRPLEAWRREEPPDERDKVIEALRSQVGAAPRVVASGVASFLDQGAFEFRRDTVEAIGASSAHKLACLVRASSPPVRRETLVRRYGLAAGAHAFLHDQELTLGQIEEYESDYRSFLDEIEGWAESLPSRIAAANSFAPVAIEVANNGTAVASNVVIRLSLEGPLQFVSRKIPKACFALRQGVPDAPKPRGAFLSAGHFGPLLPPQADPYGFELVTDFDRSLASAELEFRCDQFRHHSSHILRATVAPKSKEPARGCLNINVLAENTCEPTVLKIPVRVADARVTPVDLEMLTRLKAYLPREIASELGAWLEDGGIDSEPVEATGTNEGE